MKLAFFILLTFSTLSSFSQNIDKIINATEVERIERVLSADDMEGRKIFTPGIEKAAAFIEEEFKKNKLQFLTGLKSYRQEFSMYKTETTFAEGTLDGVSIDPKNIIALTTEEELKVDPGTYTKAWIRSGDNFRKERQKYLKDSINYIVFVDSSFYLTFPLLSRYTQQGYKRKNNTIFVLSSQDPASYSILIRNKLTELKLRNVVGIIPGKSKKDEFVIFSCHYDHLGIGKPNAEMDSIFNGANDDAAGTTAVILLSKYFKNLNDNERTLIFVAFTGEESGGYGAKYFSKQLNPDKVVAMFNIEMIGTESKWGTNSAYITGYDKSDFGKILQENLTDSKFHFEPDPYPKQNLFLRSDNAKLAELGVPAHTISTSKMDTEKYYHTLDDEIETLDMNNMAEVIKAVAISSKTIVSGVSTPTRVTK